MKSNDSLTTPLALAIACVTLSTASFAAIAGKVESFPVLINKNADRSGSARGALRTARRSSNAYEFIQCTVGATETSQSTTLGGNCLAQNAKGDAAICFTKNPALLENIRSATDYSHVSFSWRPDGSCTSIQFSVSSTLLP